MGAAGTQTATLIRTLRLNVAVNIPTPINNRHSNGYFVMRTLKDLSHGFRKRTVILLISLNSGPPFSK